MSRIKTASRMELVNEVLCIVQDGLWERRKRNEVLHVLTSRFSHRKLLEACDVLKEWIGYRADLEDVVKQLAFDQYQYELDSGLPSKLGTRMKVPSSRNDPSHNLGDCTTSRSMIANTNHLTPCEVPKLSLSLSIGGLVLDNYLTAKQCHPGKNAKENEGLCNNSSSERSQARSPSVRLRSQSYSEAMDRSCLIPLYRKTHVRTPSLNSSLPDALEVVHKPLREKFDLHSRSDEAKEHGCAKHTTNIRRPKDTKIPYLFSRKVSKAEAPKSKLKSDCSIVVPMSPQEKVGEKGTKYLDAVHGATKNPSVEELRAKYLGVKAVPKPTVRNLIAKITNHTGRNFIAKNISDVCINKQVNLDTKKNSKKPPVKNLNTKDEKNTEIAGVKYVRRTSVIKGEHSKAAEEIALTEGLTSVRDQDVTKRAAVTPHRGKGIFPLKGELNSIAIEKSECVDNQKSQASRKSCSFIEDFKGQHSNTNRDLCQYSFLTSTPNVPTSSTCSSFTAWNFVPDDWIILKDRGIAVPPVTLKIWRLVKMFWHTLPQFVGKRTPSWAPKQVDERLQAELRGINRLLEQVHVRLEWVLPVLGKDGRPSEGDESVEYDGLQEEIKAFRSSIVNLHQKYVNSLSYSKIDDIADNSDYSTTCSKSPSLSSDRSCLSTNSRHSMPSKPETFCSLCCDADEAQNTNFNQFNTGFLHDCRIARKTTLMEDQIDAPAIKNDLLCWMQQAVKSSMDDELIVLLIATHYTLQEVHQARNVLTSYNIPLSCMKGVRGLLYEMLGAFNSVADENNNVAAEDLPKFVCHNVNNRPLVRPVGRAVVDKDLKFMRELARKLTTQLCWVMPEAERYSEAMEAAGTGSLNVQLKETTSYLHNLKKILLWELNNKESALKGESYSSNMINIGNVSRLSSSTKCNEKQNVLSSQLCDSVQVVEGKGNIKDVKSDRLDGTNFASTAKDNGEVLGRISHSQLSGYASHPGSFVTLTDSRDQSCSMNSCEMPSYEYGEQEENCTGSLNAWSPITSGSLSFTQLQSISGRGKCDSLAENVTTPIPPERPWIRLMESDLTKPSCIFTVMCYNVLCDKYATRQMYGYCPSWALEWEYRKKGIMDEIKHYMADIITLQEVETDQFFNFFLPELKNEGYDGIFSPKSRAKHMTESERKYVDGCAIFWRTTKFALVKERLIEFNQLAMANHDGSEDMLNRVMTKDNIGLAALLETKEAAWENSVLPDKSQVNQPILVCTAHIHWDPEFRDVKLIQTIMLMSEIRQIITQIVEEFQHRTRSGRKLDPNAIQLLLCGDLNSLPESGVVEFLTKGNVSMDHEDFKGFGYKTCLQKIAVANASNPALVNTNSNIYTHSFRLSAAYDFNIMAYTNYTYDFKGIIDYIFHNSDTMTALGVLGPIDPEWFRDNKVMGCPHPHIPSDHFPLLVQLEMRPVTSTLNHPNGLLHR